MARFSAQSTSVVAVGAGVNVLGLFGGATAGAKLRRVTMGTIAGAGTPSSQQLSIAVFRATAAGTATTNPAAAQLDPNSGPALCTVASVWSAQPTLAAASSYQIPFNTQSSVDLPWELLEEWVITKGTANGLVFQNLTNPLPAGHFLVTSIEWEE